MLGEQEAADILQRMLAHLFAAVPRKQGRVGSDFRHAVGDLAALGTAAFKRGVLAPDLANCFTLARKAGATYPRLDIVRLGLLAETPLTVIAIAVTQAGVRLCLSQMAYLISASTFTSRTDAEAAMARVNDAFEPAETFAADSMDTASYGALVTLHAALTRDLADRGRMLPLITAYEFAESFPSLTMAQRIYATAGRADQLREENKVVHPAFMPDAGRAMSR